MSESTSNVQQLQEEVKAQGELIRKMKTEQSDKKAIKAEVKKLKALKKQLDALVQEVKAASEVHLRYRANIESLLTRRFFYQQAFEIYGGIAGLYDYGPPGCALMQNIMDQWRRHFVFTESMLEVNTTCVTPEVVLKTSGHVDKFTDFMVTDTLSGECYRADKLLEEFIEGLINDPLNPVSEERKNELLAISAAADDYNQEQLGKLLTELKVKPAGIAECKLTDPYPFNLMFATSIGPSGKQRGFLRPETAQGIFVNFGRLLKYNNSQMPFAAAQIGLAFRNEIAPRAGLLRVREFQMMEIEHFCNPNNKAHPKFSMVADVVLSLLDRPRQDGKGICAEMTIGDAVAQGVVDNQTLGYFMARTQMFLVKIGCKRECIRFRQHKANEMAHYAQDCWDAELKSSYGWVECVGHADRSAYDLKVHSAASNRDLHAREDFKTPQVVSRPHASLNNKNVGRTFGRNQGPLRKFFKDATNEQLMDVKEGLEAQGSHTVTVGEHKFELNSDLVTIQMREKKITGVKYIPSVIEPSFGLGRILYSLLEHAYTEREGTAKKGSSEKESYLKLSPLVAPTKAAILTQSPKAWVSPLIADLSNRLADAALSFRTDNSGVSIGRKYARADEIGTPFSIVIDLKSNEDQRVTIRDRDSTLQVRVAIPRSVEIVRDLCTGRMTWTQVYESEEQFGRPE